MYVKGLALSLLINPQQQFKPGRLKKSKCTGEMRSEAVVKVSFYPQTPQGGLSKLLDHNKSPFAFA